MNVGETSSKLETARLTLKEAPRRSMNVGKNKFEIVGLKTGSGRRSACRAPAARARPLVSFPAQSEEEDEAGV